MDQEECQIVNHISTGLVWPGSTNGWWLGFHQNRVPPSEWKENFRMSRESFLVLCTELNDHIVKSSTRFRKAVSVEEEVPLTLYCLSDGGRLRKTVTAFGLGKSTVSHIIRLVYKAFTVHLTSKHIKMSRTKEAVEESVSNFYSKQGICQCIGATDRTHVPIKKLSENATDYINRKGCCTGHVYLFSIWSYCY